jgi:Na+-transporting methylmalonyl-CoA/oxaloacetate decarboxylase gamma subunit
MNAIWIVIIIIAGIIFAFILLPILMYIISSVQMSAWLDRIFKLKYKKEKDEKR